MRLLSTESKIYKAISRGKRKAINYFNNIRVIFWFFIRFLISNKYFSGPECSTITIYIWANTSEHDYRKTKKSIYKNWYSFFRIIRINPTELKNLSLPAVSHSREYALFIQAGDSLDPLALIKLNAEIQATNTDVIYFDDTVKVKSGNTYNPRYKPTYSKPYLFSYNFIGHSFIIRHSLLPKHLSLDECFETIVWRLLLGNVQGEKSFHHLPEQLLACTLPNQACIPDLKLLVEDLTGAPHAALPYEPWAFRREISLKEWPLVSIIVPFKDKPELLTTCIESIINAPDYPNFEIIGISNNSVDRETFTLMETLSSRDKRIRFIEHNIAFNFSALNNRAVEQAKGSHLVLLNNDVEIISKDWLIQMLYYSSQKDIGAVGARLYYPNDTVQHAGIVLGIGGIANHAFWQYPRSSSGYELRLICPQEYLAVTAACLMVKKELYKQVGGLNEKDLAIAYNDVDFCLRLKKSGYHNIYCPYAEAYHYESISRGAEITIEKKQRLAKESAYLLSAHPTFFNKSDPFYHFALPREKVF